MTSHVSLVTKTPLEFPMGVESSSASSISQGKGPSSTRVAYWTSTWPCCPGVRPSFLSLTLQIFTYEAESQGSIFQSSCLLHSVPRNLVTHMYSTHWNLQVYTWFPKFHMFRVFKKFIQEAERNTHTHTQRVLSSASSLPRCLRQLGLSQAKVRHQNFNLDLSHVWSRLKYLGHRLLLPRVCISRELEPETELAHSDMGHWLLRSCVSIAPFYSLSSRNSFTIGPVIQATKLGITLDCSFLLSSLPNHFQQVLWAPLSTTYAESELSSPSHCSYPQHPCQPSPLLAQFPAVVSQLFFF